jgi:hypothetical protein
MEDYRDEDMLSPVQNPGDSDDLMMVRWWSLAEFRLGNGLFCQGSDAVEIDSGILENVEMRNACGWGM